VLTWAWLSAVSARLYADEASMAAPFNYRK
jgi:hypothetical protein